MSLNAYIGDMQWTAEAACIGIPTNVFYPGKGGDVRAPKRICAGCPVREQCLEFCLAIEDTRGFSVRHGVFGGMSPEDRARLAESRRR